MAIISSSSVSLCSAGAGLPLLPAISVCPLSPLTGSIILYLHEILFVYAFITVKWLCSTILIIYPIKEIGVPITDFHCPCVTKLLANVESLYGCQFIICIDSCPTPAEHK